MNSQMNHLAVKELPMMERPYEKLLKYGESSLTDAELLAIILRSGSKQLNSIELAREVLKLPDNNYSLMAILKKPLNELQKINGIGIVKASMLKCIAEISIRISESSICNGVKVDSPIVLINRYMERMRLLDHEQLLAVFLNGGNCYIGDKVISSGTVNRSLVPPREIFLHALKYDAVYIILIHNHPSGNPAPSKADIDVTKILSDAGELLGIKVLDHLIIGDKNYYSFRENRLM